MLRKRISGGRAIFDVQLLKPLGLTPRNFPNRPGVGIAKIKEGRGCWIAGPSRVPGGNTATWHQRDVVRRVAKDTWNKMVLLEDAALTPTPWGV